MNKYVGKTGEWQWPGRNAGEAMAKCSEVDKVLEPCPFCGEKAFSVPSGATGAVIRCTCCPGRMVSEFGIDEAVTMWNRRA